MLLGDLFGVDPVPPLVDIVLWWVMVVLGTLWHKMATPPLGTLPAIGKFAGRLFCGTEIVI